MQWREPAVGVAPGQQSGALRGRQGFFGGARVAAPGGKGSKVVQRGAERQPPAVVVGGALVTGDHLGPRHAQRRQAGVIIGRPGARHEPADELLVYLGPAARYSVAGQAQRHQEQHRVVSSGAEPVLDRPHRVLVAVRGGNLHAAVVIEPGYPEHRGAVRQAGAGDGQRQVAASGDDPDRALRGELVQVGAQACSRVGADLRHPIDEQQQFGSGQDMLDGSGCQRSLQHRLDSVSHTPRQGAGGVPGRLKKDRDQAALCRDAGQVSQCR